MEFSESAGLGVYDNGILKAEGTAGNPIIFNGKQNIKGYWRGIHTETPGNRMSYVTVQHAASNYVYCCNEKAGIIVKDGDLNISNSNILDNDGCGIFVKSGATLTESGNTFSNNTDGHICN